MYGISFSCKPTQLVIGDSNWGLKAVLKMSRIASLNRPLLIAHLTMQITRLSDQQSIAMQEAAFVEMTEEEANACGKRSARTAELLKQLEMIR